MEGCFFFKFFAFVAAPITEFLPMVEILLDAIVRAWIFEHAAETDSVVDEEEVILTSFEAGLVENSLSCWVDDDIAEDTD